MFREDPLVGVEKDRIPLWANAEPKLHYEMSGRPLSREQLALMVAADPPGTSNLLARGVIQRLVCLHGGAPPAGAAERQATGQPEEKSDDDDSGGIALGVVALALLGCDDGGLEERRGHLGRHALHGQRESVPLSREASGGRSYSVSCASSYVLHSATLYTL